MWLRGECRGLKSHSRRGWKALTVHPVVNVYRTSLGDGLRWRQERVRHRLSNEPRREKTGFCICENKDADQLIAKM